MTETPDQNRNQEISEELQHQVVEVKNALSNAKERVEEVQQYYQEFQELKTKLEDNSIGLNAVFNFSQDKKSELDKLSATATEQLSNINQALEQVRQRMQEVDASYTAFKTSRDKVNDPNTGLEAQLIQANQLKNEITILKKNSIQVINQINEALQKVQENTVKMEEVYRQFESTKEKIYNPTEGLEALLQIAADLKYKIQDAQKSASNTIVEINSLYKRAKENSEVISTTKKRIENIEQESISLKESIAKTLTIVTDSSLDNAFKARSDNLHKETREWRDYLFGSIILLAIGLGGIYFMQSKAPNGFEDWKHWYRYLFASPLLYAVYFCTAQYNLSRSYAEKYAFKSVIATTLSSYIKLLDDRFPDRKPEILNFTLKTTDLVYERPFTEKDTKKKVHISLFNIFKGKLELDEKTTEKLAERVKDKTEEKRSQNELG